MKNKLGLLIFFSLLFLGFFFRLWRLDKAPISLFGDELDVGLQGYSILTTGKDYLGNKFPIMFHSFSEYRLPMQLYLVVPFIKLFGLNEFGVRGPAVFSGFITLILFYFLAKEIFDKRTAAVGTLFLTFSPWHFNFSRQANDAGILLPFILAGVLFFIKGTKNYKFFLFSALFFALSIYTYAIATVFVPLLLCSLTIIYRKEIFKNSLPKLALAAGIGLIILLPYMFFVLKGTAGQRFSGISVAGNTDVLQQLHDRRRWSDSLLTKVLYNKDTVVLNEEVINYIKSFSTTFLFSEGDPNLRQGVAGFGEMYMIEAIFVFVGLSSMIFGAYKDRKNLYLLLTWLLLAPIPSALTKDGGNHAARLIPMLIPLVLFSAFGFLLIWDRLFKSKKIIAKIVLIFIGLFILVDFTKFIHRYFVIWPNESWRFWQYGFKETINFVKSKESNYGRIVFNNTYEPMLPRFLFYYQYDMNKFQKEFTGDKITKNIIPRINGFKLGEKYYFGELGTPTEDLADKSTLVIASGEKDVSDPSIFENSRLKLLFSNYSPTGIAIFYIFTGR